MRHESCITVGALCGLLVAVQSSSSQILSAGQEARILRRFPQADRDGDGKLSAEELAPLREQLEKWQAKRTGRTKQPKAEPKGPAPTYADLKYGEHKNTVMDVWLADSDEPAPIVVAIHGGGFKGGDKSKYHGREELKKCLARGVSFATINYRFRHEDPRGVMACLHDSKRAIQFIRHHAKEWNIDKHRVAAYGGSAGAGTTLWLACHDEMADPDNPDPVLRESTRLAVGGLNGTQATYDIMQWKDFIPSQQKLTSELEKAREPAGSAPFLHVLIPEDQWMDMERDADTGTWTATLPLKDGVSRIDFFSNHGRMVNGYKHYLSSPYTRVELSPPRHR